MLGYVRGEGHVSDKVPFGPQLLDKPQVGASSVTRYTLMLCYKQDVMRRHGQYILAEVNTASEARCSDRCDEVFLILIKRRLSFCCYIGTSRREMMENSTVGS